MSSEPEAEWPRLLRHAAHELRTPLGVGLGYLGFILSSSDGPLTARQRQFVAESQKALGRLRTLADEMTELARLEAGEVKMRSEKIDLDRLLDEAVAALPPPTIGRSRLTSRRAASAARCTATSHGCELRVPGFSMDCAASWSRAARSSSAKADGCTKAGRRHGLRLATPTRSSGSQPQPRDADTVRGMARRMRPQSRDCPPGLRGPRGCDLVTRRRREGRRGDGAAAVAIRST